MRSMTGTHFTAKLWLTWIWVAQGFEFHQYEHRSNFLTISQVAQELLGGLIGDKKELMTTVKETFDSLTKASDVFTLFGFNSIAKHGGNFQIFVCDRQY